MQLFNLRFALYKLGNQDSPLSRPPGNLFYLGDPCRFPQAKLKPPPPVATFQNVSTHIAYFSEAKLPKNQLIRDTFFHSTTAGSCTPYGRKISHYRSLFLLPTFAHFFVASSHFKMQRSCAPFDNIYPYG